MTYEILNIEQLAGLTGGSWYVREDPATRGGITLKKSDGSPGSWGWLWNTGDYYFKGNTKISGSQAHAISIFVVHNNRAPESVQEAETWYNNFDNSVEHE